MLLKLKKMIHRFTIDLAWLFTLMLITNNVSEHWRQPCRINLSFRMKLIFSIILDWHIAIKRNLKKLFIHLLDVLNWILQRFHLFMKELKLIKWLKTMKTLLTILIYWLRKILKMLMHILDEHLVKKHLKIMVKQQMILNKLSNWTH